jgi:hypothetical protein
VPSVLIAIRDRVYHGTLALQGAACGYEACLRGLTVLRWNADWYEARSARLAEMLSLLKAGKQQR